MESHHSYECVHLNVSCVWMCSSECVMCMNVFIWMCHVSQPVIQRQARIHRGQHVLRSSRRHRTITYAAARRISKAHDATHPHAWYETSCHMCDMTRPRVFHDSSTCVSWIFHTCDTTHPHVWHESFARVTWLVYVCDMTHQNVWHDSSMCVTFLCMFAVYLCQTSCCAYLISNTLFLIPLHRDPQKETHNNVAQKRPTKETYKRDLQKRPTKEILFLIGHLGQKELFLLFLTI